MVAGVSLLVEYTYILTTSRIGGGWGLTAREIFQNEHININTAIPPLISPSSLYVVAHSPPLTPSIQCPVSFRVHKLSQSVNTRWRLLLPATRIS